VVGSSVVVVVRVGVLVGKLDDLFSCCVIDEDGGRTSSIYGRHASS
jgi:hypothetical protein